MRGCVFAFCAHQSARWTLSGCSCPAKIGVPGNSREITLCHTTFQATGKRPVARASSICLLVRVLRRADIGVHLKDPRLENTEIGKRRVRQCARNRSVRRESGEPHYLLAFAARSTICEFRDVRSSEEFEHGARRRVDVA
jgi:hypothetical protein